jgi:hypothetical protein
MNKPFRNGGLLLGACLLISFSLLLTATLLPLAALPRPSPAIEPDQLVARWAPVLHFDANETVFPSGVEPFVSNSRLMRWENGAGAEVERNATISSLSALGGNATSYYLDNSLGSLDDGAIERWYQAHADAIGPTVYCRFASWEGQHFIQYWMFYGFNNGTYNRHEGDWEMFMIILGPHLEPTEAVFSQHQSGARVAWDAVAKGADGAPWVYVTRGSHGLSNLPGSIDASPASTVLHPVDYELVTLTNATTDDPTQPWLAFGGRWGEWGGSYGELLGTRGPEGPMFRLNGSMWAGVPWSETLPLSGTPALYSVPSAAIFDLEERKASAIGPDGHAGGVGGARA